MNLFLNARDRTIEQIPLRRAFNPYLETNQNIFEECSLRDWDRFDLKFSSKRIPTHKCHVFFEPVILLRI